MPTRPRHQDDIRLRLVFDGRVVSVPRATDLTCWEIAETLDDLRERYGEPIAIDVFTGSGPSLRMAGRRLAARPGNASKIVN
jgi:hypothetical protein